MSYYISFSYFKLAQKLTISAPTLHWAGRGRAALLCTILQMHGRTFFSSADAQLQLICWWRAATVSTAAVGSSTLLSPLRQKLWRSCVSDNSGAVQPCCIVLHIPKHPDWLFRLRPRRPASALFWSETLRLAVSCW